MLPLLGMIFMTVVSMIMVGCWDNSEERWKKEAIEHGAAEYNRTTGEWQWIEKAEKETQ
jgi:hypothetical protein